MRSMMRRAQATLSFVVCLVAACVVAPDKGDAGADDAGTPCDGKNDCNACVQCASQVRCAPMLSACQANSACVSIDECVTSICGADLTCKQQCIQNNPEGANAYDAATRCLYCSECPKDCAGYRACE